MIGMTREHFSRALSRYDIRQDSRSAGEIMAEEPEDDIKSTTQVPGSKPE